MLLKVGELAKRTGLTVRTLHHYDAIGLLAPSARSESGYRLYNRDDIARLHAICALRQIGMPLADIATLLNHSNEPLSVIVQRQIQALDAQIAQATALRGRLQLLQVKFAGGEEPDVQEWLATLELMSTYGKYFTQGELKKLMGNWARLAEEWLPLIRDTRAAMDRGIDPRDLSVQQLARRWLDLTMRWMNGDRDLLMRWETMVEREPAAQNKNGVDAAMRAYIKVAIDLRMNAIGRHFTDEELRRLKDIDHEWVPVEAAAKRAIRQGLPREHKTVQRLFARVSELVDRTVDHDPLLRKKLLTAFYDEPVLRAGTPLGAETRELFRDILRP